MVRAQGSSSRCSVFRPKRFSEPRALCIDSDGAYFTYHKSMSLEAVAHAVTEGYDGADVRVDFASTYPFDSLTVDADQVSKSARCMFGEVEVEATYVPADTLRSYPRLTCQALPETFGSAPLRVSLDGQHFSAQALNFTLEDPWEAFYGMDSVFYALGVARLTLPVARHLAPRFVTLPSGTGYCVSYETGAAADAGLEALTIHVGSGREQMLLTPRFSTSTLSYYVQVRRHRERAGEALNSVRCVVVVDMPEAPEVPL